MEDTYKTIAAPAQGLYKDKGSKFLAFAYSVESVEECKAKIEALRKEYYDARHHCYAYILGPKQEVYRANDDGEPSGTAGRPIHGQILSAGLTNVLVVVVRYFGGTLLGTSGLITAYKAATQDALQQAQIVEKIVMQRFKVTFPYEKMNTVMRIMKDMGLQIVNQEAAMDCTITFAVRASHVEACQKKFTDERLETVPAE